MLYTMVEVGVTAMKRMNLDFDLETYYKIG